MAEKEWMTIDDLREYLSISRSTVFNLLRQGTLPHSRVGKRKILFSKKAIDKYLEARSVPAKKLLKKPNG